MVYRITLLVSTVLVLLGCAAANLSGDTLQTEKRSGLEGNEEAWATVLRLRPGADCPGTVLDEKNGVLCLMEFPGSNSESHQTIVSLKYGADCPGSTFDGLDGVFCLIEYPNGWRPFVHDGHLYYKIELSGS